MRKTARILPLVLVALMIGSAAAAYAGPVRAEALPRARATGEAAAAAQVAAAGEAAAAAQVAAAGEAAAAAQVAAAGQVATGGGVAAAGEAVEGWQPTEDDAGWQRFRQVMQILQEAYVDVPDMKKLWDGALRGAVEALGDKYSVYLEPREYEEFRERVIEGSFGGVGIVIELVGSYVTVVSPLPGTPAERAGLQPGDRILRVDGQDVVGWLIEAVGQKIRGEPGTKVILSIQRGASSAPFDVELVREKVRISPLDARVLDGQIAYLKISSFELGVGKNFSVVMAGYRRQGIRKYILDLRGNGGGLLGEALQVAQEFLPRGTLVKIVQRGGNTTSISSRSAPWDYSLVVLVDGGTASAAEIVAGAIADRGYGMLVGSRTFGKGSVQTVIPFSDGAALKVTTARFLTPLGHVIDGKGIEPRVTVPPPQAGESRRSSSPTAGPASSGATTGSGASGSRPPGSGASGSGPLGLRPGEDPALEKALEILGENPLPDAAQAG